MEELLHFLNQIQPLSPDLEAHLRSIIKKHTFLKGEHLLRVGETSGDILFLRKGLVRSYYLVRGKDVSNWFMKEGDICISILSFFRQKPSVDSIVALEDCDCWGIRHVELEGTYIQYPEFNIPGRLIATDYYCRSEERHQAIRRQTPEDKYAWLMEEHPELVQRVPLQYLSSFLDISDSTLTQIRRGYANGEYRKNKLGE